MRRSWFSPPDRREITLILISLSIFTLSYNLDASLRLLGVEPLSAEGAVQSAFLNGLGGLGLPVGLGALSGSKMIGRDGRKLPGRRDEWENEVWGEWEWEVGFVAGEDGKRVRSENGSEEDGGGKTKAKKLSSSAAATMSGGAGTPGVTPQEERRLNTDLRHKAYWLDEEVRKEVVDEMWKREGGQQLLSTARNGVERDTADKGIMWWRDDVPSTKVLVHLPGHTILDNVILFNGSAYLVRDQTTSNIPPLGEMVQRSEFDGDEATQEWVVIDKNEASSVFGDFGGIIRGVSWLSNDPTPHNSTLFSLWRLYTLLERNLSTTGLTTLPQPRRLILPHTTPFSDPPPDNPFTRRTRSPTGFHPYLPKVIFPKMGVLYKEDWEDYMKMERPFLLERIVLVDRRVAVKMDGVMGRPGYGRLIEESVHGFGLGGHQHGHGHGHSKEEEEHDHTHDDDDEGEKYGEDGHDSSSQLWFEPIRLSLTKFLGVPDDLEEMAMMRSKAGLLGDLFNKILGRNKIKKVVTYIHTQGELVGGGVNKLAKEDHERLVEGLKEMVAQREGKWNKWEVNVVSSVDWETGWNERLDSIAKSSIILGVHGPHLMDSIFMKRTPWSTLFELFPFDSFSREYEVAVKSVGLGYTAWSGTQKYADDLPPISLSEGKEQIVKIDVDAVLENVKQVLHQMP
ncbi:hypothetical protein BDN72DRAFT_378723 [Pluteus cervinus]|uniref:Uncharacterized protein n=1 Tax=Pluteus cervinus TaxID=181527 RepID=A0ACD3B392_9AGAR|nr:hypothetical protein BDN72DRAFT_378723 [Pluteus cervinus]